MTTHEDHHKHSSLFLVRVSVKEARDNSGKVELRGKVQRVVDGEAHQFSSRQGLLDLLQAMLVDKERR